jgi:hypothetical protein
MMIKQSANAEPDAQHGVRFVPYRDMSTNIVIDPNSTKNYSRNVALAIAFIAADRDDWHRFIPIGLRTLALDAKKKREAEIVAKQNQPYATTTSSSSGKQRKAVTTTDADGSGEEEGEEKDDEKSESTTSDSDDDEEEEQERRPARAKQRKDFDEDDDVDDKLKIFDHITRKFVPATKEDEAAFALGFGQQQKNENDDDCTEELLQRLARTRLEQEQREKEAESTLPSDRKRRQAASLNDPQCESNLSEITQRFRAADSDFDLQQARQVTREKEFGIPPAPASSASTAPTLEQAKQQTKDVLQRFAPPAQTAAAAKKPQYTTQELMQFGAKTQLPPSIQQQIDRNKNPGMALPQQLQPQQQQQQQQQSQQHPQQQQQQSHTIEAKLKAIRRKNLELMQLVADLEDQIQK